MLAHVDLFLAQTAEDSARLQSIGAEPERVQVTGNLKFDVSLPAPPPIVESLRQSLAAEGAGPVLVCGSTVEDEEPPLLKAFENLRVGHPRAVMILAPRHPERFDDVAILLQQLGIPSFRRSQWQGESLAGGVLLVDTIGELAALYALADVAFVGGSLVPRGGHNIIEPAQHGVAIVTGNHTENFRDIVALFQSRDAVRIVSLAELPLTLMQLLADDAERRALGRRALRDDAVADRRDAANPGSAEDIGGGESRSACGPGAGCAHRLNPLSAIYGGVVGARNALYDRGLSAGAATAGSGGQRGQSFRRRVGEDSIRDAAGRVAQGARNQVRCAVARLRARVERRAAGRSRRDCRKNLATSRC